jgi:hypothetical protein
VQRSRKRIAYPCRTSMHQSIPGASYLLGVCPRTRDGIRSGDVGRSLQPFAMSQKALDSLQLDAGQHNGSGGPSLTT